MRAPVWTTTTSGRAMLAAAGVVTAATIGVGVSTYSNTGSTTSSNSGAATSSGTAMTSGSTNSAAQAAKTTPCNGSNCNGTDKSFTVSGDVTDLAPGVSRTISLTITNNASQAVNLRTVSVQAADGRNDAGAVVCAAANLLLGSPATPGTGSISPVGVQIAGRGTVNTVTFPVRLAATATDACQSVRWALTYSGSADQA